MTRPRPGLRTTRRLHCTARRGDHIVALMAKAAKEIPEWRITEIRQRGRSLGRVRADTAEEAIKTAIEEFGVTEPHRQK